MLLCVVGIMLCVTGGEYVVWLVGIVLLCVFAAVLCAAGGDYAAGVCKRATSSPCL